MQPKPKHLKRTYAEQFKDQSVVNAYHHRPPYSPALGPLLSSHLPKGHKTVLDVGCGLGHVARPLAPFVDRVDAVDFSEEMIAQAKTLPGGKAANIHWIRSPVETAPLSPPYGLITAGQSLHWLDWEIALPRLAQVVVPDGRLFIIGRRFAEHPWQQEMGQLISRFSTNQDFEPYDLIAELETRGLFVKEGTWDSEPVALEQTITDFIEALHSSNGFSRDRMTLENARAFDDAVRELVWSYTRTDSFETTMITQVTWGRPIS